MSATVGDMVAPAPPMHRIERDPNITVYAGLTIVPDPLHALALVSDSEVGPVLDARRDREVEMGVLLPSMLTALADERECPHERLPTDTTPPCGCWPEEAITEQETPVVTTIDATHPDTDQVDPDAPWGRKRDGSPCAKPGRKPKAPDVTNFTPLTPRENAGGRGRALVAEMDRIEREQAAFMLVLQPGRCEPEPIIGPTPVTTSPLLARFEQEIGERLGEIGEEMNAIILRRAALDAEQSALLAEMDELVDARDRLVVR